MKKSVAYLIKLHQKSALCYVGENKHIVAWEKIFLFVLMYLNLLV